MSGEATDRPRPPLDQPQPLAASSSARTPFRVTPHSGEAFSTLAAWRPPEPRHARFTPANDWRDEQGADPAQDRAPLPAGWKWSAPTARPLVLIGGVAAAALLGAMLGTAFQL